MKRPVPTVLALAVCVVLISCQRSETPALATAPSPPATVETPAAPAPAPAATTAPAVDLEQVAQRVVTQSAGVKEGDAVLINGRPADAELIEDIAVEVPKAGGFPMVQYGSDRLAKRLLFDVPAKYDTQTDMPRPSSCRVAT
jgi:aminopeptidase